MVGSIIAAVSAKKAAKAQSQAFGQAADLQSQQYQQTRQDLAPYRETGVNALAALRGLYLGEQGPDYSAFFESPGYQFRFDEGVRALDRSASARGRLLSGGYGRELVRYGQGFASNEFNNYANRLAALAGIGQSSTAQTGVLGASAAQARGGFLGQMGTARASGYIGQANALLEGQRNFEQNNIALAGIGAQAAGSFVSSRKLKENNAPIDYEKILEGVEALAVEGWNYIHDEAKGAHIGPYAEDFLARFGLGDGESIDPVDAIGVLFAAVKALVARVRDLEIERGVD